MKVFFVDNGSASITGTLKLWNNAIFSLNGGSLSVGALDFAPNAFFTWTGGTAMETMPWA